jgi:hypothetical protein
MEFYKERKIEKKRIRDRKHKRIAIYLGITKILR